MNEFGKTMLRSIAEKYKEGYAVLPENKDTSVVIATNSGTVHRYTWLYDEEKTYLSQFPHIDCCIIRYDSNSIRKYKLHIRHSHVVSIQFSRTKNKETLYCRLSEGDPHTERVLLESLKHAFAQWVQNLPCYRLHFVTGEWEMEVV